MSSKNHVRTVAVEFHHLTQDKYQLASQIAQQRDRLKQNFPAKTKQSQTAQASNAHFPRSYTMRYFARQSSFAPVLTRACIASVVLFFLARRIGYKNLWRFGSTLWVLILPLLEQHFTQNEAQENAAQTGSGDENH